MRTVYWLFAVSVLLFISGIAFIIAGERTLRAATPAAAMAAPETQPVATVKQIMIGITNPAAYVVYEAVGTKTTSKGIEEIAPQTDEDWAKVASAAAAVVESGNLMLTASRAIDKGDWVKMTRDMMDQGQKAMKAAAAKSTDGIVAAGGDLNTTCDNCHARYQR
jgi:cytochrome c556